MKSRRVIIGALLAGSLLVTLTACRLPRDPEHTRERVENGTLRVGISENPPWTHIAAPEPTGREAEMVRALAAEMHARVEWMPGGEQTLMEALESHRLDLVVGGITKDTPWAKRLSLSSSFAGKHVWLAPAGENAWLLTLNRFLHDHDPEASR